MLLTMVFLIGLIGAIALATDSGHLVINKTRLQNALDSTALSAAITLNEKGGDAAAEAAAILAGTATFAEFIDKTGNSELESYYEDLQFDFANDLVNWTRGANNSLVRASATVDVNPILAQIYEAMRQPRQIAASSTAGAASQTCQLVPLVICPDEEPAPPGPLCDASGCNGVPFYERICLKGGTKAKKTGACSFPDLPTGNFGLLRFDGMAGGADIRDLLAGTVDVCTNTATWENGNKVGPVSQGIGDRFAADREGGDYNTSTTEPSNNYGDEQTQGTYKYDSVHPEYDNPQGIKDNRLVAIPVVDSCEVLPIQINEATCLFLTEQPIQHGGVNEIYGELRPGCNKVGHFDPTIPTEGGPYNIVLYKTKGSPDS